MRVSDRLPMEPGEAVAGCDGVLTVLVPWGVDEYSSGTAQVVLDHAEPEVRLMFSFGWRITRDGEDKHDWKLRWLVPIFGWFVRILRVADLNDRVEACGWERERARAARAGTAAAPNITNGAPQAESCESTISRS